MNVPLNLLRLVTGVALFGGLLLGLEQEGLAKPQLPGWALEKLPKSLRWLSSEKDGEKLELYFELDETDPSQAISEKILEDLSRLGFMAAEDNGDRVLAVEPHLLTEDGFVPMVRLLTPIEPVAQKKNEVKLLGPAPVVSQEGSRREGALSGKVVYLSASHGLTWVPSLARWATQRGNTFDMVEDFISAETINQFLTTYLENAGAQVFTVRERDMNANMVLVDTDERGRGSVASHPEGGTASSGYSENGGSWTGRSEGFKSGISLYAEGVNPFSGGGSREIATSAAGTARAEWGFQVPESGRYMVYVSYVAGGDRAPDARYEVKHAGGSAFFEVDQRRHGETWVSLGRFYFYEGDDYKVILTNASENPGTVVSADAIRVGGGMGSMDRGVAGQAPPRSPTSERPRWEEASRYYTQYAGAPSTVYAHVSNERNADVSARPRYAAWQNESGEDSVYIAWHTNAASTGTARGTTTYVYGSNPVDGSYQFSGVPGSDRLAEFIHEEIVNDMQKGIDTSWRDRGIKSAYFGEVNPSHNNEMPSALVEVAFHDNAVDSDHLKNPRVRQAAARAFYQGIVKYFADRDGKAAVLLPEPVQAFAVEADGLTAKLSWRDAELDSMDIGGHAPTGYRVYRSYDGRSFDEGQDLAIRTQGLRKEASITGLTPGEPVFFRVTAYNQGGESLPSVLLGVNAKCEGKPEALLVHRFNRLQGSQGIKEDMSTYYLGTMLRIYLDQMNRFDATVAHAFALAALQIPFDSAEGLSVLPLSGYHLIDVVLGEQSTLDRTFTSEEQALVLPWIDDGKTRVLISSGAEIAWDLDAKGGPSDKAFLERLGAKYGRDDAGTYGLSSSLVGGPILLDDGSMGTYDVDYPDVLIPVLSDVILRYDNNDVAGVKRQEGASTALTFGVPLESLFPDEQRELLFQAFLEGLDIERGIEACGGTGDPNPGDPNPGDPNPGDPNPGDPDGNTDEDPGHDAGNQPPFSPDDPFSPGRQISSGLTAIGGCQSGSGSHGTGLILGLACLLLLSRAGQIARKRRFE